MESFNAPSTNECIRVDCPYLPQILRPTDLVFFDDGKIHAEVIDVTDSNVKIRFKDAGCIKPHSQMKLQGAKYESIPVLNVVDIHDLKAIF